MHNDRRRTARRYAPRIAETAESHETVVVGAGLAGLAAARVVHQSGRRVLVLEGSDGVGGRVRSDVVDGFRLDRGFQVVLTAYPEFPRQLDVERLQLRTFDPGAMVWWNGRLHAVGDPLRMPKRLVSSALAPVGGVVDKARLALLLQRLRRADPQALLRGRDIPTIDALRDDGFGDDMIDRFFRPLFGGIQLDPDLTASRRMFDVVMRCLVTGRSAVPALGMQAIPDQMRARLPDDAVRLNQRVVEIAPGSVRTADGASISAKRIVVATDGPTASALTDLSAVTSRSVSCAWFAAPTAPTDTKSIILDGTGAGPALNVAVMTNIAPEYSQDGTALVVAACPGIDAADVEASIRTQLRGWWGPVVDGWRHLRTDAIAHGQPDSSPPLTSRAPVALGDGMFVCGDHRDTPSIQGALVSGRRCGRAVLASLS